MSKSPDDILSEASSRLIEGKLLEALELLRSLQRTNSSMPEVNYILARCYQQIGRHEQALESVRRELEIQPANEAAKQLEAFLSKALSPPEISEQHFRERPWHSSVPVKFLQALQRRLHNFSYLGTPLLKNPFDLAIYSQLLWALKPRTIVEIGSKSGGSAIWFAHQLDVFQREFRIFSIDLIKVEDVAHPRVTFLQGDANDLGQTGGIDWAADLIPPLLLIDDANHQESTCIRIADFFHPLLRQGDYFVIEDGIISDLSPETFPNASSGPHMAIRQLLERHPDAYIIDRFYCDMFGYNATWCTNGFLRRL
jgi:cephalosporin hydroxylase